MVVAQTTRLSARARCAWSARSAAAYRACSPQAVDEPNAKSPTSSRGSEDSTAATTVTTAPRTATAYPTAQPGTPARSVADPREGDGDDGRAEHRRRLPETGRGVGAGDVAGQQPTEGDPHGDADPAQRDAPAEHAEGAPLHAGDVGAGPFLDGHGPQSGRNAAPRVKGPWPARPDPFYRSAGMRGTSLSELPRG